MLSDDELERYARQIVLPQIGGVGQRRLKEASAIIIGAGGIGSAAIPALAGAGIGRLTIIDEETVELSNLHRQWIFRTDQIGQSKAAAACDYVKALNPLVETAAFEGRITAGNAPELLRGHSLVLDGSDNFATRLAVSDAATKLAIPLVSAAAVQLQGQVSLYRGWEPDLPCYRCFVGDAFDTDDCDTCAELGVVGALPGMIGNFGALLAIRMIAAIGDDPAGKLFLFDGLAPSWRTVSLPKDPACKACG